MAGWLAHCDAAGDPSIRLSNQTRKTTKLEIIDEVWVFFSAYLRAGSILNAICQALRLAVEQVTAGAAVAVVLLS